MRTLKQLTRLIQDSILVLVDLQSRQIKRVGDLTKSREQLISQLWL